MSVFVGVTKLPFWVFEDQTMSIELYPTYLPYESRCPYGKINTVKTRVPSVILNKPLLSVGF